MTGSTQPNDLQFVPEGLWVLDQLDQPTNKAFLVKPEDGTVIREILTEALHASGITYGNGALWIGSTKGKNAQDPPKTMKVDPKTGKTLKQWNTPGAGLYGRMSLERGDTPSGAHGLKWIDGKYWMAVPAANKVFLMEPETGEIVRSIPGPGQHAAHARHRDRQGCPVGHQLGRPLDLQDRREGRHGRWRRSRLSKDDPVPHGLDMDRNGALWYCDAGTSWICKLV